MVAARNSSSSPAKLPVLAVLVILLLATVYVAVEQTSTRTALSPWEPSIAMEALRLNAGLPVYETGHATHLYGPLLTLLLAGVFKIFGLNLVAVRVAISLFGLALAIFLSGLLCSGKSRFYWAIAVLSFLGINLRTNLILFSTQPDWPAAFLAVLALYFWIRRKTSTLRSIASLGLFVCAVLCKQTSAAFALIPFAYVLLWKRPLRFRDLTFSLLPPISILLAFAAIRLIWPEMFNALVLIPASIKVYPGRALNLTLYLFATFPIFFVALWSTWRFRGSIMERERWVLSALVVLIPISIWTTCKSGAGYNSLLFAYYAMTALFVTQAERILEWARSLSIRQSLVAGMGVALAMFASFFLQLDHAVSLLSLRHGDGKYDAVVALARNLRGTVRSPQDPTIAYRGKRYFGRSLFFELDAHADKGNWPKELPASILDELQRADYVIVVHGYIPTPVFEDSLPDIGFHPVVVPELAGSAYTLWSKSPDSIPRGD